MPHEGMEDKKHDALPRAGVCQHRHIMKAHKVALLRDFLKSFLYLTRESVIIEQENIVKLKKRKKPHALMPKQDILPADACISLHIHLMQSCRKTSGRKQLRSPAVQRQHR